MNDEEEITHIEIIDHSKLSEYIQYFRSKDLLKKKSIFNLPNNLKIIKLSGILEPNVIEYINNHNSMIKIRDIDSFSLIEKETLSTTIFRKKSFHQCLQDQNLPDNIINQIPQSWDIIGDILIVHLCPSLIDEYGKKVGEAILNYRPLVKTVCTKVVPFSGELRCQTVKILAGENKKESIHSEFGCKFLVHVEKFFFSLRMANERIEIRNKIIEKQFAKEKIDVLTLFCGVLPFPIVLARDNPKINSVIGVELNAECDYYANKNIQLNELENVVEFVNENAIEYCESINNNRYFDVIICPCPRLPNLIETFLPPTFNLILDSTLYFFFDFLRITSELNMDDLKNEQKERIERILPVHYSVELHDFRKCGAQFSPGLFRFVTEFTIHRR
eukprot:TRINITY_DN1189_c0_g1_i2.p1 TRINITY_DN1189_c0_g1~~TRINITY_DN1189_c0_g1_i2.p1  ORF type:complete len:401 (-),score=117.84 TRINITY_DN1189_c0_g1_i2:727-1890(-)